MQHIRAVIFDMDGVIVNSEPLHEKAFHDVMEHLGYSENHGLDFDHYVGRSDFELWMDFIAKHRPPQQMEELLALKLGRVLELVRNAEPIFAGLPELVAKLARRYPLALASGSERPLIEAVLALRDLRRYFPIAVNAADVEKGKPAPDIFLLAARKLGFAPQECCVIEDSKPGVTAGLAAGMEVIAITNTHPADELRQAHHVVRSYAEIEALLSA